MAKYHKISRYTIEAVQWTGENFDEVKNFCEKNGYSCLRVGDALALKNKSNIFNNRTAWLKQLIRFEHGVAVIGRFEEFEKRFKLADDQ